MKTLQHVPDLLSITIPTIHTFGAPDPLACCCKLPWLPPNGWPLVWPPTLGDGVPAADDELVVDANRVGAIGGRLIIDPVLPLWPALALTRLLLLFKWFVRRSKFSLSSAACCNFNSLIADISSSFCVSSDERDSISWKVHVHPSTSSVNNHLRNQQLVEQKIQSSRISTPLRRHISLGHSVEEC